jgi:hypothetical protein
MFEDNDHVCARQEMAIKAQSVTVNNVMKMTKTGMNRKNDSQPFDNQLGIVLCIYCNYFLRPNFSISER